MRYTRSRHHDRNLLQASEEKKKHKAKKTISATSSRVAEIGYVNDTQCAEPYGTREEQ